MFYTDDPDSYVSPRKRAQRTLELLNLGCHDRLPWQTEANDSITNTVGNARVQVTEDIREWDYGAYEGLKSDTIRKQREEKGEGSWDIWRDGCPDGEYVDLPECQSSLPVCKACKSHTDVPLDLQNRFQRVWTV